MSQFEKCKVVMLPTNEKAQIYKARTFGLGFYKEPQIYTVKNQGQHLYILSMDIQAKDDEIKKNDWYIYPDQNFPWCNNEGTIPNKDAKKIIATTNTSLTKEMYCVSSGKYQEPLPQPSKSFVDAYVKAYNEGNPITEVMVEYEEDYYTDPKYSYLEQDNPSTKIQKLKIAKDNTITIRKIKDSWSRAEILKDIEQSIIDGLDIGQHRDKWVK